MAQKRRRKVKESKVTGTKYLKQRRRAALPAPFETPAGSRALSRVNSWNTIWQLACSGKLPVGAGGIAREPGGRLYASDEDGGLVVFKASLARFEPRTENRLAAGCMASPQRKAGQCPAARAGSRGFSRAPRSGSAVPQRKVSRGDPRLATYNRGPFDLATLAISRNTSNSTARKCCGSRCRESLGGRAHDGQKRTAA